MATFYTSTTQPLVASPAGFLPGDLNGGTNRSLVSIIDLSAVPTSTFGATSSPVASGDTIVIGRLPANAVVTKVWLTSTVTLGSSTVAIGTAASAGAYRAAATFTAVNTPTPFAIPATATTAGASAPVQIIATIGAANLPGTGIVQFEVEYVVQD